ncbi:MAG: SDR family oxidoreductase [Patescibacteria group bacterium]
MSDEIKQGRVSVISGGTGYVGSAIAKKLAEDGMKIAVLYKSASDEEVAKLISEFHGTEHASYKCDLADAAGVTKTIERIEAEQGPIFAAVHAAGTMPMRKQLYLSTVEDLREQFEPNVFGSFNFLSACALHLAEHGDGVIVGITTAGVVTDLNTKARGAYSPMKFALQGMLVALREELLPHGVRVYSVAPGVMPGGMNAETPKAFLDMVRVSGPTKTLAEAKDVAGVVSFLCSESARELKDLTLLLAPESAAPNDVEI